MILHAPTPHSPLPTRQTVRGRGAFAERKRDQVLSDESWKDHEQALINALDTGKTVMLRIDVARPDEVGDMEDEGGIEDLVDPHPDLDQDRDQARNSVPLPETNTDTETNTHTSANPNIVDVEIHSGVEIRTGGQQKKGKSEAKTRVSRVVKMIGIDDVGREEEIECSRSTRLAFLQVSISFSFPSDLPLSLFLSQTRTRTRTRCPNGLV